MYKAEDFKRCVFNPLCDDSMLKTYPKLRELFTWGENTWRNHKSIDGILRYVCAMYDQNSPLITDIKELDRRKEQAAILAGFNTCSDVTLVVTVEGDLEEIDFDDEDIDLPPAVPKDELPELITLYLAMFQKSLEWAAMVAIENKFWESTKMILAPVTGKDSKDELTAIEKKSKIADELEKDIRRIQTFKKSFFDGDEQLAKRPTKRSFSPELVAGKRG